MFVLQSWSQRELLAGQRFGAIIGLATNRESQDEDHQPEPKGTSGDYKSLKLRFVVLRKYVV